VEESRINPKKLLMGSSMRNKRFLFYAALLIVTAAVFAATSFMGGAQNADNTARHGRHCAERTGFRERFLFVHHSRVGSGSHISRESKFHISKQQLTIGGNNEDPV
jgi:hypothetical protein